MILLDTCVLSEVLKPSPNPGVVRWLDSLPEDELFLPSLVVGELQKGVGLLDSGSVKDALALWIEQLLARFQGRILSFDSATALVWGDLTATSQKNGRKLPVIDSLLAAFALSHQALFVTRNVKDFEPTGIRLYNPWE